MCNFEFEVGALSGVCDAGAAHQADPASGGLRQAGLTALTMGVGNERA